MKVTKSQLKQIIKEELAGVLGENSLKAWKRLRSLDKGEEFTVEEFEPLISQVVGTGPDQYDTVDEFVWEAWKAGLVPGSETDIDPGPEPDWKKGLEDIMKRSPQGI